MAGVERSILRWQSHEIYARSLRSNELLGDLDLTFIGLVFFKVNFLSRNRQSDLSLRTRDVFGVSKKRYKSGEHRA